MNVICLPGKVPLAFLFCGHWGGQEKGNVCQGLCAQTLPKLKLSVRNGEIF